MKRRMNARAMPVLLVCLIFDLALLVGPGRLGAQETSGAWSGEAGRPGETDGTITLQEILDLARGRNPRLNAAASRVEASLAREPGAGALPDPMIQLGVMNLALPELSATMPASMAPTLQASQMIPFPGKLALKEKMAKQSTQIEKASGEEVWWGVRTDAATAFYRVYEVDRQIGVMRRTLALLQDLQTIAQSMYSAGGGRQTDVLRASVEVARMDAEIQRMVAMRKGATARLNAVLNRAPDVAVPSPALGGLPAEVPATDTLVAWAVRTRPLLQKMHAEIDRAETARSLADKQIWPDFTVGLQYGLGRMAGDPRSMGGAMLGFSIPIHAGSRQYKARDEAAAMERVAQAGLDDASAQVNARIEELVADTERSRSLINLYREEILPQSRSTVQSSLSSYRVGAVDFMTILDAEMAQNRFEGEYYGLLASYGTSLAQLEMAIGRELPAMDALITEAR